MGPSRFRRSALVITVSLCLATAPACGGDDKKVTGAGAGKSSDSTTSTAAGAEGGEVAAGGYAGVAGSATTAAAGGSASGGAPPKGGAASGGGATAGGSSTATGGPAPVTAGTYRYRQSGSSTFGASTRQAPPEGSLQVDQPKPDRTQRFHRAVQQGDSQSTTFAFKPDGMFLVSLEMGQAGVTTTCTFDPAMPAPPWPPTTGKTFAGNGKCGGFTIEVSGKVSGTRQVTLDGTSFDVSVVEASIVTHGQAESTGTLITWFAPALRLPVHTEERQDGTYGGLRFSSNVTSDLVSAKPA